MSDIKAWLDEMAGWSDERLTSELSEAARNERRSLISLLLRLGEFIRRGLSERKGYASAFDYCTRKLGYSRSGSYRRMVVARAGLRLPSVLSLIESGDLHLTGASMVAPHLTAANNQKVLRDSSGKSESEIARIVAAIAPAAASKDRIRIIWAVSAASMPEPLETHPMNAPASLESPAEGARSLVQPSEVSPTESRGLESESSSTGLQGRRSPLAEMHEIRFAASGETVQLLHRAQALLRHQNPDGAYDVIFNMALQELLDRVDRDRRKLDRTGLGERSTNAEPGSSARARHIPEAIKQEVWSRDEGRCGFIGSDGVRCLSRAWLEYDHKVPYAHGGRSDDPDNIGLLCRAHNQLKGTAAIPS